MATKEATLVADWESVTDAGTPIVFYRTLEVDGLEIFYREAGPRNAPTILLLHGFPSSSHMFRNLIPMGDSPDEPNTWSSFSASTGPIVNSLSIRLLRQ